MNDEMKATDWSFFHQKSSKTCVPTTVTAVAAAAATTTTTTALPDTIDSYKLSTSRKIFDDFFQNSLFSNSSNSSDGKGETSGLGNGIVNGPSSTVTPNPVADENQNRAIDTNETIVQQPPTGVSLLHNYIGRRLACATSTAVPVNDSLSAAECGTNADVFSSAVPALLVHDNDISNSVRRQQLESHTSSLPIVSAPVVDSSTLVSLPLPPQSFVPSPFDDHDNNTITSVTNSTANATSTCRKTPIPNKFIDLFELGDYFDMTNTSHDTAAAAAGAAAGVQSTFPFTSLPAALTATATDKPATMTQSDLTTSSIFHDNENKTRTTADIDNCATFLFNNLFETTATKEVEITSTSDRTGTIAAASDFVPIAATPFDDFDNDNDNDNNSDLIKCFSSQSLINLVTSRDDGNDDDSCFASNGTVVVEGSHATDSATAGGGEYSGLITPPSPAPHTFSLSSFLDEFSLVDAAASGEQPAKCISSGCDAGNDSPIITNTNVNMTTAAASSSSSSDTATIVMPATNNPFFLHSNNHIMNSHQVSNVIKDICFTLKNTKKIDNEESTVAAAAAAAAAAVAAVPTVSVTSSTLVTNAMTTTTTTTTTKPIPPPRLSNGALKSPIWVPRYSARDNAIGDIDNSAAIVHENGNDYDNENQSDDEIENGDESVEHDDNGNNTNSSGRIADNLSITADDSATNVLRRNDDHSNQCDDDIDTDLETDRLLGEQRSEQKKLQEKKQNVKNKTKNVFEAAVLEKGVSFVALYLGSTQIPCKGQPTKSTRMLQAEEAVSRIKAPEGENQPNTEVDLFISTKKIMVLNKKGVPSTTGPMLKEMQTTQPDRKHNLIMEHDLRTISYIADIGKLVVLMARRKITPHEIEDTSKTLPPSSSLSSSTAAAAAAATATTMAAMTTTAAATTTTPTATTPTTTTTRTPKMICHIFESKEAQRVAQTIGQSFQLAYMSFLQENGIEDNSFVKEMDYQEVLNSQEIFGNELNMFAKKELQKEVIVPKAKNEILGVVIVESGWGSMLPTVVIANLAPLGPAFRCSQLNIGDQIIAINGISLVGLPLSTCQTYIKQTRHQSVVKLTVVPCAPVVEVKIKRPDTKYQLGFSVQNGVICSLLRGGIAERGGVRVGHRIIEINNQSVVAVPHEKIVNILATSVGEILMKTMPTSMFRLLTGQENPIYI